MARQMVCDGCGKTDPHGLDWLKLTRRHRGPSPEGVMMLGAEELDFHHEVCVVSFLQREILHKVKRGELE